MLFETFKKIKNNAGLKKYLNNSLWLLGQKIFDMIVNLILSIWVVRYLGPIDFGSLSYAISYVGIFASIATLGLDSILVKELVNNPKMENHLLGSALILRVIGAITSLTLIYISLFIFQDEYKNKILIYIISCGVILRCFNILDLYFQSKVLSKYVVYSKTISLFICSVIKIIMLVYGASVNAFAMILILEVLFFIIPIILFYCNQKKSVINKNLLNWKFDLEVAKTLFKESWPLMLAGIVISIYMKIDQIMIQKMIGNESVGLYAAATKLSAIWYFIPVLITSSLFPALINAKKTSQQLFEIRLQRLYIFLFWLAISIAIPLSFFSHFLTYNLYGEQYDLSAEVLRIHIWTGIFVFVGVASDKWLLTEGLQIFSLRNCVIGALFNIFLNLILIETIGIIGAAYSTLFSQAIASYLLLYISKKTRPNFYMMTKSPLFIKGFK